MTTKLKILPGWKAMTKLRMPPNCVDVTSEYVGTTITLVGCSTSDKQFVHELRKKIAAQKEMEAERENPASNEITKSSRNP